MPDIVGILGGMGPRATVKFEEKLLACLDGIDQDLPTVITINDGSIPDRSSYLCGAGSSPVPHLRANVERLVRLGANILTIPCNTAHVPEILDAVLGDRLIELIHMPEQTIRFMSDLGTSSAAILGTRGLCESGLYQTIGTDYGVSCRAFKSTQALVGQIILAIKADRIKVAKNLTNILAQRLESLGVEAVILACTELSFVSQEFGEIFRVIDSLDVLAMATKDRILTVIRSDYESR